jgi:tetratricopeptide (TPR) repeat protein
MGKIWAREMLLIVAAVALYCPVGIAGADPVDEQDATYRAHVQAALVAYEAGDLAQARTNFVAAYARYPNARALRGLGTVELEQRDHVAAATHLEQALASTELPLIGPLREETESALAEANQHVGRVLVLSSPADAALRLDDRPISHDTAVVLAPGVYKLELSAAGYHSESRQLMVSASQSQLIQWPLMRVSAPADPVSFAPTTAPLALAPTGGPSAQASGELRQWILIGSGAAMLAGGVALLAVGIHDYRQLSDANAGESYREWQDTRDRYPKLQGVGGALMGVGATAMASGIWWRVRGGGERAVRVSVTPESVLLNARF